jgi:short-subunit dehydrogenase
MPSNGRKFAIVTGASTGIGFELAKICLKNEYDVLIAADEPEIEQAATTLRQGFGTVEAVQADLAGPEGVDRLYAAARGRTVDLLLANAGRGLGHALLDQDPDAWQRVVDTNITGTLLLVQKVGKDMRRAGAGRILVTGSIAGFMPSTTRRCTTAPRPSSTASRSRSGTN